MDNVQDTSPRQQQRAPLPPYANALSALLRMAQPPAAPAEGAGGGGDEVAAAMRELGLRNADRCGACGAAAALLGSTCRFCRCRFCLKHAQAEAHGCGRDAAATERCGARARRSRSACMRRAALTRAWTRRSTAWLKVARDGAPPPKPSDVQAKARGYARWFISSGEAIAHRH